MLPTSPPHYLEAALDGALLGLFMISAAGFGTFLEHPASAVRRAIPNATVRRVLMGLAMGATAAALIYSPWGRRSGAHMNPAVTLTFVSLGKVTLEDGVLYVAAQVAGGLLGLGAAALLFGRRLADPAVSWVVTVPAAEAQPPFQRVPPAATAFACELLMSFVMMGTVLVASNSADLMRWTGLLAGELVALYIAVLAPYSGMSLNPARTLASALPARRFDALWVYLAAPPLGMLAAARLYVLAMGTPAVLCAKLQHLSVALCHFCGH